MPGASRVRSACCWAATGGGAPVWRGALADAVLGFFTAWSPVGNVWWPHGPFAVGMQRFPTQPAVIAHRGASPYAQEHTYAAYDLALAHGADALELDLRATADGEPVVVHDATLRR